jgi:hypothetical protein
MNNERIKKLFENRSPKTVAKHEELVEKLKVLNETERLAIPDASARLAISDTLLRHLIKFYSIKWHNAKSWGKLSTLDIENKFTIAKAEGKTLRQFSDENGLNYHAVSLFLRRRGIYQSNRKNVEE